MPIRSWMPTRRSSISRRFFFKMAIVDFTSRRQKAQRISLHNQTSARDLEKPAISWKEHISGTYMPILLVFKEWKTCWMKARKSWSWWKLQQDEIFDKNRKETWLFDPTYWFPEKRKHHVQTRLTIEKTIHSWKPFFLLQKFCNLICRYKSKSRRGWEDLMVNRASERASWQEKLSVVNAKPRLDKAQRAKKRRERIH